MVVAFYFRLHLAYFPRPVVAIFARPEHPFVLGFVLLISKKIRVEIMRRGGLIMNDILILFSD